jgi:hypothetical protein
MEFYDSDQAAEMAEAFAQQQRTSFIRLEELLQQADDTEKRIEATHKILLRRRRMRLEIRLMRLLLAILGMLSPENQELGAQIYARLRASVDRLEKLC